MYVCKAMREMTVHRPHISIPSKVHSVHLISVERRLVAAELEPTLAVVYVQLLPLTEAGV